MNFLAHAYLSFNQAEILAGNLFSDFIKGKRKYAYAEGIQQGIALHRAIDEFTDFHDTTQAAKAYFRKDYRLYSGAFIDIAYDHFLANDKTAFPDELSLGSFSKNTYAELSLFSHVFPEHFSMIFPYMVKYDWLYNYRSLTGIENSFQGLVRRAAYLDDSSTAFNIFNTYYNELKTCYEAFFPSLKIFASNHLQLLIKK